MGRGLVIVTLAVVLAGVFGCGGGGGSDYVKKAPPAKPIDIGLPEDYPIGVTSREPNQFVVKTQVDNETRLMVLESKVPGPKPLSLTWDDQAQIFHDDTDKFTYSITGDSLKKITLPGPRQGEPGIPMFRFKVSLDKTNGHVLLDNIKIKLENRENKDKGAWVVVQ